MLDYVNLLLDAINKYNEESVDEKIIKNIFSEYKILGKIKFNKIFNRDF